MGVPGLDSIISKVAPLALGAGQLIQGAQAKKRANEVAPELVDPTQSSFLAELQQKKNALNTGSEYTSSLDAINDKMAQTQDAITQNAGGDSSGAISGLLRSQRVANQGTGQLLGLGERQENMYTGLYGDLLDKISNRKMELQKHAQDQNMAEWAQKSQNGAANLMGALGQGKSGGGSNPSSVLSKFSGMGASAGDAGTMVAGGDAALGEMGAGAAAGGDAAAMLALV